MVAAIVWLSLTPAPPRVDIESGDKLGHLAGYGLLMFWFARLYARRIPWAAGFIAMGIGLEFVQGSLGYRSFELYDMLANTAGVLLGWGAAALFKKPLFQ
ncbi:MAG TPA: VanZ family protein [Burkholderiales bacterium]